MLPFVRAAACVRSWWLVAVRDGRTQKAPPSVMPGGAVMGWVALCWHGVDHTRNVTARLMSFPVSFLCATGMREVPCDFAGHG